VGHTAGHVGQAASGHLQWVGYPLQSDMALLVGQAASGHLQWVGSPLQSDMAR